MKTAAAISFILIVLFLVSTILANVSFASQQDSSGWPMFHSDLEHSGYSSSQAPKSNQTLWAFNTGGQIGSPAVANGVVYVGSYDHKVMRLTLLTARFYGMR